MSLFIIDCEYDFLTLGDQRDNILKKDADFLCSQASDRHLLRIWNKITTRGFVSVWDVESNQALDAIIMGIPSYAYLSKIDVKVVYPHAIFPHFGDPTAQTPAPAQDPIYWVDIEIDRAKAGPEGFDSLYKNAAKLVRGSLEPENAKKVTGGFSAGIWRKASGNGAYAIWEYPDHESLSRALSSLPLLPTMRWVTAGPLLPYPALPSLAGWTRR